MYSFPSTEKKRMRHAKKDNLITDRYLGYVYMPLIIINKGKNYNKNEKITISYW